MEPSSAMIKTAGLNETQPGTVNLKDVWGSSASDVYVVGEGGFIAQYDGSSWTQVTQPYLSKS